MNGGYPIAAEALDLEVYVLAALFAGSASLSAVELDMNGIRWVRQTFEVSEISRRLISLAVVLRSALDDSSLDPELTVGRLTPNVAELSRVEDLSLREACNKIIHAQDIDLAPGFREQDERPPISRKVLLRGFHRESEWTAELDTQVTITPPFWKQSVLACL
jgi:hypothetical protein